MLCSGNVKYTYEYVKQYFTKNNCTLLEERYIGIDSSLKYKCVCNEISKISFYSFKNGVRCQNCAGNKKYTYEYITKYFREQGCELLEKEYINNETVMKYKCKCGNNSQITFGSFKMGHSCKICGYIKQENSSTMYKDYKLPSGNNIKIQGYENIALDELIKNYNENDIITNRNEMPKIMYFFKGKLLRYYPDIWIKSENKIIEVKSIWTYKQHLIKNIHKALSTRKLRYYYEIWIYDKYGNKNII